MKDWIVTVWLPFVVRVERADDGPQAKGIAQDYLDQLDPLTGPDTLVKIVGDAADPTVFSLAMEEGLVMHAAIAADSEDYCESDLAEWSEHEWTDTYPQRECLHCGRVEDAPEPTYEEDA